MIVGTCHQCKAPQCEWTCVRCAKGPNCMEIFCFPCLSKVYPALYGSIFRGICWACPACQDACKCETCTDPVKKRELQTIACEQYTKQMALLLAASHQQVRKTAPPPTIAQDTDNSWSCPRCSVLNNTDDIECSACLYHKRRSTRKRTVYSTPQYEERHSVQKEPVKRAREHPYDDKSPPQKGRVSALRQLVKNPWIDGWELARKLALDLVEEAKQQAIRQGLPVLQVRQLPTKYQLANSRGTHVRKWFDREPTLAKKFLRAAGLICSKSNGTFINQDIPTIDDLPPLILKADLSRFDQNSSFSDEEDSGKLRGSIGSMGSISASGESSAASSPSLSPTRSPSQDYHPKLKVYYHRPDQTDPFVFKVPIDDLSTIDEVKDRLGVLLHDMGQTVAEDDRKTFVLTGASDSSVSSSSCVTQNLPCTTMDDLTRCSLLHVHAP